MLRALLEAEEGLLSQFLRESVGCHSLSTTPWVEDAGGPNTKGRRFRYLVPMPDDIPDVVAKAFQLPPVLQGTTLSCIGNTGTCLLLLQQSRIEGMLFSDRFRVQNILAATDHPSGGVEVRQWADVVWTQPLPWTHSLVGMAIERRCLAMLRQRGQDFARIMGEAVAEAVACRAL